MRPTLLFALLPAVLAGCSSHSSNVRIGTDQSYVSLADQRAAVVHVTEYPQIPAGAVPLGQVDAGRCHRVAGTIGPTEAHVLTDLKVAAFAQGADGIANVTFAKDSGLVTNCWYVITGRAVIFKKPPAPSA